jgi:predicted acetyltransferase
MIEHLMSVTDEAHAALWRFCLDVDLMTTTGAWNRATDDPLPWMLADPRHLQRSPEDGLWIRLVDVAAALSGRRYMRNDSLVLEVRDAFCPWNDGRYALDGGPDGAHCRKTSSEPDFALSAADLAATYLGAVSFTTLSLAGRVEERKNGALRRADVMFATELKPWCPYSF